MKHFWKASVFYINFPFSSIEVNIIYRKFTFFSDILAQLAILGQTAGVRHWRDSI